MSTTATPAQTLLTPRRRWSVLVVCATAMFLVGLDTTIVNLALPRIGQDLGTSTRGLEWVVDAYTVVFASLLITSGALADRWGRRRVFRVGLVAFGAASLLGAAAPSVGLLVVARALQGVGASMLSPVALAIVVGAMPDPKERARAIGVWASVFGLSMAAGPVVGGALLATLGWRSVFWVSAPLVVATLVLVAYVVPESHGRRTRPLDGPGQLLLVALVALAVGLLIEGPHVGWSSPPAVAGYLLLAVVLVAFVRVESRRTEPLIDPGLFRVGGFTSAVIAAVATFVGLSLTLLLTTFLLQRARAWTPLAAGAATLPMALGATVCAPLAGILVGRIGAHRPLAVGGAFLGAGGLCLTGVGHSFDVVLLLVGQLAVGVGIGFANAPITSTAVSSLPLDRAAVAGGITSTARQVGAAAGVALAGGLVAEADQQQLSAATQTGYLLVTLCGLVLVLSAYLSRTRGR